MSHAMSPVVSGPPLEGMDEFSSVNEVFAEACRRFADKPAFTCMGRTLRYAELERLSRDFAAWLSHETDLEPGDRIAIQLPNVLQFPVAIFGAMRAGLVVVNTNPLYTEREMAHQFQDAGVKAILILANMADKLERILPRTDIRHVLVTELGDMHGFPKGALINAAVKHVKKMVPRYSLPDAIGFRTALSQGHGRTSEAVTCHGDDIAVLQYTGGTTGVAKGSMLTHRNLIANMLQTRQMIAGLIEEGRETIIAPLPVYHIYTFTVNCLFTMVTGNHTVLIPNPRDIDGFIKTLRKTEYTGFVGLNTLFNALCQREDFRALDFSRLKLTISGGMALTKAVAKRWEEVTGCAVLEGYGMTETSPIVCVNPPDGIQLGTIGKPVPGTSIKVIGPEGEDVPRGEPGELCVKGPQVMKGYWQRPEDTARAMDDEGWIRTGDIAVIQEDDYVRIVDRKKDMIIVSGFNVYPNEVEDVVAAHEDVVEVAAIGVSDDATGEAIKLFVVSRNEALDAETLRGWCKRELSAYKVPKLIEFRDELPKTNVGKVLRRELRDSQGAQAQVSEQDTT
ncbi:long-chain fatty acid--CoA ligase [Chromohalobacter israelensis]|uniref:Long-chain-fatty-acid--CoA ligase n=1 Tax=Chromohalobacter israelensis (strain ATCC BAA-138 / DSM 3043 / CIP 106854 / NCIMB 13768 / 1H11) TaxID=290398 RepID=Q1QXI7_CHRI1|nr:long-chain fatty acid--CoA ligase [Chromohalobacter salexigens]ABE58821.1 AMP-dependent synthetase and ligase [Chromohalobacter salexigens DSM 3043]